MLCCHGNAQVQALVELVGRLVGQVERTGPSDWADTKNGGHVELLFT